MMRAAHPLFDRPDFSAGGLVDVPGQADIGGFLAGTMVFTADGLIPIEYLAPGDRVVTRTGLCSLVTLTARRQVKARLVRIRNATQASATPGRDLLLSPDQRVVLRDWRAQAMFGQTVATVAAARLIDGEFIVTEDRRDAWLFIPRLANDAVIYAEGLETALTRAA